MMDGLLSQLQGFVNAGGYVMPPLLVCTVVLWFALGYRWSLLQRGNRSSVRVLIRRVERGAMKKEPQGIVDAAVVEGLRLQTQGWPDLRARLDDAFAGHERNLKRYARLITTIVVAAPLLGLLGTVSGMIETFDSLGDMTMFSQTGGIAGGISQALFTTQMGLAVAIPGLVIEGLLARRQRQMQVDLAQIKDILCSEALGARTDET